MRTWKLPIADSILYIRPLYVKAQGTPPIPLIRHVIAATGDQIALGDDLAHALSLLFPGEDFAEVVEAPVSEEGAPTVPDGSEPDAGEPEPDTPPDDELPTGVEALLAQLAELRAQQDDLSDQQSETNARIDELIEQLLGLLGAELPAEAQSGSDGVEA